MAKETKIGLIGFGMAGQVFHAPIISGIEGLKLIALQTSNAENIRIAARKYPEVEIAGEMSAILENPEIDLIVIATPNATHFELTKKALLADKHVVVDKPFTATSAEAFELIEIAQKHYKLLTVHQNRRWDSDFLTVRKVLESKLLGRLVEAEFHYDRFRNTLRENTWKEEAQPGTGILYDLGSHLIDQAQTLFGLPEKITADIRTQRTNGKIADSFELILHYPSLKVTLKGSWLAREPLPHFTLHGELGSFVKYGMDVQEEELKAGATPENSRNWGIEPKENWGKINTDVNGLHLIGQVESEIGDYRQFYENVRAAIQENRELEVTAAQGANTIKIIEAAMKSQGEQRTVNFD